MSIRRRRKLIDSPSAIFLDQLSPTLGIGSIGGVRVYDVGQGDALAVLDEHMTPFLQIDYGGRSNNPFRRPRGRPVVDSRMPLGMVNLLMLTHWDDDHWCSARKNLQALRCTWLTPRQRTSPSAAVFSAELESAFCMPENLVGREIEFRTSTGDRIICEKIAPLPKPGKAHREDPNRTGVAFSIVKRIGEKDHVILLPGDAPFHEISHYRRLQEQTVLRGVVAYHHGSHNHWTNGTKSLLSRWHSVHRDLVVIYSYAAGNSYRHPTKSNYVESLPLHTDIDTPNMRANRLAYDDVIF